MVQRYYDKSGIKIPMVVRFARVKTPAKLKTRFNPKTRQYISNIIQINDKHYQEVAKVDIKSAKAYLQFTIAHELGHLKRVQDNWDEVRGSYIKGIVNNKEEDFADRYASRLTGISVAKHKKTLDVLQKEYDKKADERHRKAREEWEKNRQKREEKNKKREAEINRKYDQYFKH